MQRVAGVSWAKPDSDIALFGTDDLSAVPPRGSLRSLIKRIAFQCSRRCMPSWHCIRASEPVRPKSRQQKKLRAITGAVICRQVFALIHDRDMKRHIYNRLKGAVAFGAVLPETSILCFQFSPLTKALALDFFQSKALNIGD